MIDHDPLCRCKHMRVNFDIDDLEACDCPLIEAVRLDERRANLGSKALLAWVNKTREEEREHISQAIDTVRQRRWDMVTADDWDDLDLPGHEEGVEFGLHIAAKIARSGG